MAGTKPLASPANPPHDSPRNGRATLGFLTANIHIGTGRSLWPAVVMAAEQHDVNLICFPGGGLRSTRGFEIQRNAVYDLIGRKRLDGLVSWASTVGGTLDLESVAAFHRRFQPLPLVSLSQLEAGIPTVSIDSYTGMRSAVIHLIEAHGFRRLAFLRGPEGHFYAQERFRAYMDVLKEYGIPFDPALVSPPMHWEAGAEAVRVLLDEHALRPGIDFQAIVAVSDLLALGALNAMRMRGIPVPGQVALVGFNDATESRVSTPPLTTVALPLCEQGSQAVEMLLARIRGRKTAEQALLDSRLVIRQSCGCPSAAVVNATADPRADGAGSSATAALSALGETALAEIAAELGGGAFAEDRAAQFIRSFRSDLQASPPGSFLLTLERLLGQASEGEGDLDDWQSAISVLRRQTLPVLPESARPLAENLFGQARVVVGETALRAQTFRQWQVERQTALLQEIGQALITTFDITALAKGLAESLPRLGIASGYLALYEKTETPREFARLVLAFTEKGRASLPPDGLRIPAAELMPEELLPAGRRYSLVVEPLYFRETQIGYAVFEIGPLNGAVYETLRGHISSALKGDLLFQEVQTARVAAEKANQVKTRLLANVSHELRAPLNIILDHTQRILREDRPGVKESDPERTGDIRQIQHNAEHQLRVINDLLDLSRAEIDELDLHLTLLDPRPLMGEVFSGIAAQSSAAPDVEWKLDLPDRLPLVQADPVRLRQILLNLLSNAAKFTRSGHITLGAEVAPPSLHLWVEDTGIGIPADQQERVFEPFQTGDHEGANPPGIGLGLSITRHLVALHNGSLLLESQPGKGSTFHVHLPLPAMDESAVRDREGAQPVLLWISSSEAPAEEIRAFCRRQNLEIRQMHPGGEWEDDLRGVQPAALAWDLAGASPGDWALVRRFRTHPQLCRAPFILYGQGQPEQDGNVALTMGLTSYVVKQSGGADLLDAIRAANPVRGEGDILIVDDDPAVRADHEKAVRTGFPGYSIRTASDGATALSAMSEEAPNLVVLDLMMPGMGGAEVLDWMRADPRLRPVPVIILTSKLLTLDDVKRLERHARVTLQSKGVLTQAETISTLHRSLFGVDALPAQTGALVKRAIAYLHQNYARPVSRWEIAEAVGTSEDYLSRVFSRELGLSPWEYLNRYRLLQAKALLRHTAASVQTIARQVGFRDQSYFSRVFRKAIGRSPQEFRETAEST